MKKNTLAKASPLVEDTVQTSSPHPIINLQGKNIEIPEEGSLGLLALGYVGLMLWRNKKREYLNQCSTVEKYTSSINLSQNEN